MKESKIKLNVILNAFRLSLTVIMPLVTFTYVSRILLTNGIGQVNFATSIVAIFVLFASLGIYSYGVKEGAKVRNCVNAFSKLAQELIFINICSTVVAYIVFFVLIPIIPSFYEHRTLLLICGIQIGFTALGLDWIFGVYEEYAYITIRQIIVQIITVISIFVFLRKPEDINKYMWISVISSVGANIFNVIRAKKYIKFVKFEANDIKIHLIPIFIMLATQLASKIYNNIDTILLGIITTDYETGVYSAAVKINTILITIFSAMSPVFVPKIITLLEKKKLLEYKLLINKILSLIIGLSLPLIVGLEMLREPIISLLAGSSFSESADTMLILIPIIFVTSISNILYYDMLVPFGKEKSVFYSTVIVACVNLIMSIVLIPMLYATGAAIGSLIAEIIGMSVAVILCGKYCSFDRECIPNLTSYTLGSLVVFLCCKFCEFLFSSNAILLIVNSIILSVILYYFVLTMFKDTLAIEITDGVKKTILKLKSSERTDQ